MPWLVLLLGFMFFVGMWGESFDRLWGAYLLKDVRFPRLTRAGLMRADA
jgi:hypothetical protein